MKFNMGCGHNKLAGWVNVDAFSECAPDQVWDLEQTPWPWPDGCATRVRFIHSLEHMGGDPKVFLAIMRELFRICAPDCLVEIHAPHPRHDNFINDPTHVRIITPDMMRLFDREANDHWKAEGAANTPLAHYTGVDFRVVGSELVAADPYARQLEAGTIDGKTIAQLAQERLNVISEVRIRMVARKQG